VVVKNINKQQDRMSEVLLMEGLEIAMDVVVGGWGALVLFFVLGACGGGLSMSMG
tara:strand:+ start:277 stop:441 length:165 start_codon:yes stop_codon:yes gene_type:complete